MSQQLAGPSFAVDDVDHSRPSATSVHLDEQLSGGRDLFFHEMRRYG